MRFIEGVKTFVSGKTSSERMQEDEYNKKIRMEVMKAEQEEKRLQNIRLARESVRIKADAKLKAVRSQYSNKPSNNTFGFNAMMANQFKKYETPNSINVKRIIKTKKGKQRRAYSNNIQQQIKPSRYDILGI